MTSLDPCLVVSDKEHLLEKWSTLQNVQKPPVQGFPLRFGSALETGAEPDGGNDSGRGKVQHVAFFRNSPTLITPPTVLVHFLLL